MGIVAPLFSFILLAILVAAPAAAQTRETVQIHLKVGEISGVMFVPKATPAPGVMVLHTAAGHVEPADEEFSRALAKEGFVALAPEYTSRAGKMWSKSVDLQLRGIHHWLAHRPEVAGKKVGAVGFSLGAHAISLSAIDRRIRAVVVYYGAYDVRSALHTRLPPSVKLPIDYAARVHAPVLMLHGADDDEIPVSVARAMATALKAAGKQVQLVVYPGAYHRFDRGEGGSIGGFHPTMSKYTYRYDEAATKDAWKRTVAFLKANLGS